MQVITRDQIRRFGASSFPEALRLADNLALRLIDQIHNNDGGVPGTVPSYTELDAGIAWHATEHLELSLVGENLLHQRHPESGFPGPAQEWPIRSVYGKIAYQF